MAFAQRSGRTEPQELLGQNTWLRRPRGGAWSSGYLDREEFAVACRVGAFSIQLLSLGDAKHYYGGNICQWTSATPPILLTSFPCSPDLHSSALWKHVQWDNIRYNPCLTDNAGMPTGQFTSRKVPVTLPMWAVDRFPPGL